MRSSFFVIVLAVFVLAAGVRAADAVCEQQKCLASDGAAGDQFGVNVSISGDVAVIGAWGDDDNDGGSGSAYVFRYNGLTWVEEQKLTASDGAAGDRFGLKLSIGGDVVMVGASYDDDSGEDSGSVYVFRYNGLTWVEEQKLTASDGAAGDQFGGSGIALSGDVAFIGARRDDDNGEDSGSVYVFRYNGATWVEEQKLTASDGAPDDLFGYPAVNGDVAVIGACCDDDNGASAGSAYVFRYTGLTWVEEQKLTASDGAEADYFGHPVSISGSVAVIGSYGAGAYVFLYNGLTWVEWQKLTASDGEPADFLGWGVAISGDLVIVGAYGDDNNNGANAGSAYVFRYNGLTWVEEQKLTASDGAAGEVFGWGLAVSDDVAVIPARADDDNGENSGSVYFFDLACLCGADIDGSGDVGVDDLIIVILDWGTNGSEHGGDVDGSGVVDVDDLVAVITAWGLCFDCNQNGVDDRYEIADGSSPDCNGNHIPDECDNDCNCNGIDDSDEIASSTASDCNANGVPDDCDTASGTSADCNANGVPDECESDCNSNGVPDECDTASETSADCNTNGVPDECESDCNANGVPDDCDTASGASADCNANGVPDECETDCNADGLPDDCQSVGNDDCGSPITLQLGQTNLLTCPSGGEGPDESLCGPVALDVWFRHLSQCDGVLSVIVDADFEAVVAIYAGPCPGGPDTAIACGVNQIDFEAVPGVLYRFRVGSADGSSGSGTLTLSCN